jgi:ABC-2 type transport system permease protein
VGVAPVAGIGLLMGFRTSAGLAGWLGVAGLLLLLTVALTWLSVAFGMAWERVLELCAERGYPINP